jgi:short/branched chain acyl-CoA dehydrogenase
MDFDFTDEQDSFRKVIRDFAEQEIAPHAEAWDREQSFPTEVVQKMGSIGLFGLPFPEEFGGSNADFTTFCIAIEELARIDSSIAITLSAGVGLGISPIARFGTDEQRARWLPDLCAGHAIAAFGLTEPDAGSDAGAIRTRAVIDGDEWVIDGAKEFITNSGTPITNLVTITARTGPGAEITSIIVPSGTPGFEVGPSYRKMGWHASDTHPLRFDGCRVPVDHTLGERGAGLRQFLAILDDGRIAIAALAVGLAQACLEHSVKYATERVAFGAPIGANQGVAFRCADLAVMVETARLLTYKAAWLKDMGRPFKQAAAMGKLYATEAAVDATRHATQIAGGYGFIDETAVSRFYRDAKILEIGEGTSEIQRLVISRELGLPTR